MQIELLCVGVVKTDTEHLKLHMKEDCTSMGLPTFHHLTFNHPTINHGHLITRRVITYTY